MNATTATTVKRTNDREVYPSGMKSPGVLPVMLSVDQVARILNCSTRTVYRLNDAARMPRPVRLGTLVRWPKAVIDQWIAEGCPSPKGGRR